jgi:hypothetical protein
LRRPWVALSSLALVASACSSAHHRSQPAPSSTSPTTAVPATTAAPSTSSTSVAPTTSPNTVASGPKPCQAAQLSGSLGQPSGTAGAVYYQLILRNVGSVPCSMEGYPGVSFVAGPDDSQVGASAQRLPGSVALILVSPGGEAQSRLEVSVASNFGSGCELTSADGLRVYPPNQTASLIVAHRDQACANKADVTLHVGPLALGPTS